MAAFSVRLGKRLRALHAELPLLGLWAGVLACIELLGRRSPSEGGDLVAVGVLVGLGLVTARQHAARPRVWIAGLVERARSLLGWLGRHRLSMGIDLRGVPPLPRRLPPVLMGVLLGSVGLLAGAWVLREHLPGGLRDQLQGISPTLLAIYQLCLWGWVGLCGLLLFLIPLVVLGEVLRYSPRPWSRRRRARAWIGVGYALTLVAAASLLPAWVPLVLAAGVVTVLLGPVCRPSAPRLSILWKPSGSARQPAAFQWSWFLCSLGVIHLGVLGGTALLACGDLMDGSGGGRTPVSHCLGLALAWSLPCALAVVFHEPLWSLVQDRREGGGPWLGPRVRVEEGPLARAARPLLAELERVGFELAPPGTLPERTDVHIRLVAQKEASADTWQTRWPLAVSPGELDSPGLHAKLRRRWEHLCRRAVLRGIERALQGAAQRRFERGSGFWIGLHFPFVTHLTRDVDEGATGWVGPPWRSLVPRPAREYLRRVMAALELDLLFVEDGVRYRELRRVVALLFEHYDIFGPTRLDDLRLFAGLPRLRVVVHEYVLEQPFRASGYPETDYEELGRARILHVYRDRGGDEEVEPAPVNLDRMPSPRIPSLV